MNRDVRRMIGRGMFGLAISLVVLACASYAWSGSTNALRAASTPCPDGRYDPETSDARPPVVVGDREAGSGETVHLAKGCRQWADVTVALTPDGGRIHGEITFVALADGESTLFEPPALVFESDDFVVCQDATQGSAACRPLTDAASFEDRVPRGSTRVESFVLDPAGGNAVTVAYQPLLRHPPDTAGKHCEDAFSFCVLLPSRWSPVSTPVFVVTAEPRSLPPGSSPGEGWVKP